MEHIHKRVADLKNAIWKTWTYSDPSHEPSFSVYNVDGETQCVTVRFLGGAGTVMIDVYENHILLRCNSTYYPKEVNGDKLKRLNELSANVVFSKGKKSDLMVERLWETGSDLTTLPMIECTDTIRHFIKTVTKAEAEINLK